MTSGSNRRRAKHSRPIWNDWNRRSMPCAAKTCSRPRTSPGPAAIVSIGHDGAVRIERGFVQPGGDPAAPRKPRATKEGPQPLPAKLVGELTAQQTMSLRDSLACNLDEALVALTHALAAGLFYTGARVSCLDIRMGSRFLDGLAPGITEGPAGRRISARHAQWAKRLPPEPEALWSELDGWSMADVRELLAHCVGLSVDAVRQQEHQPKAGVHRLAAALQLDMRVDWQPTAAGYFGRVSRARILDAVREGVSPGAADNLAGLKKAALAQQAEQRLKDKGWLPPLLRVEAA